MVRLNSRITPCLWFDDQAEEAARLYTSTFDNSRIGNIQRYGEAGREHHGKEPGSVMTVEFELDGQPFTALNGGPMFQFTEAISFQILCADQAQIDHFWERLTAGGGREQPCGWLKDPFGLSWQVVPEAMAQWMSGANAENVMNAMFQMHKIDIAALQSVAEA